MQTTTPKYPLGGHLIYPLGINGNPMGAPVAAATLQDAQLQARQMHQEGRCVHFAILRVVITSLEQTQ